MSVGNLYFPNLNNLFCHDLTLSGDLNMSGDLHLDDVHVTSTTDSSNTATGALIVDGGVGIAKRLNVGDDISTLGSLILSQSNNGGTGFTLSGDQLYIRNDRNVNQFNIPFTTVASSTSTGALIVGGGVGIVGDLYVGGTIYGSISPITSSLSLVLDSASCISGTLTGNLIKNGNFVTISINYFSATSTKESYFFTETLLSYLPSQNYIVPIYIGNGSDEHVGELIIQSNGKLNFHNTPGTWNFSNASIISLYGFSYTYYTTS